MGRQKKCLDYFKAKLESTVGTARNNKAMTMEKEKNSTAMASGSRKVGFSELSQGSRMRANEYITNVSISGLKALNILYLDFLQRSSCS